jgi:hypothetical protein
MQLRITVLSQKKDDDEGLVKIPVTFEKEAKWISFEKILKNYLGVKKGVNDR